MSRFLILCCLLTSVAHASFCQTIDLMRYNKAFRADLRAWTESFDQFSLSAFEKTSSSTFEEMPYMDTKDLKSFYDLYKPALTFNKDKSKFVDIYSYKLNLKREGKKIVYYGEIDQLISLCNIKNRTWVRILFLGTSEYIQDVIWLSDSSFLLVGIVQNEDQTDHWNPVIYLGDTHKKSFEIFTTKNKNTIQRPAGYESGKIKKLNIQEG